MKKLQKGDIVGVVAPAGFIKDKTNITAGILLIESWGLRVKLAKNLFNKHGHFAGNDDERTSDFQSFLDDDSIKAIWCVRGGYGSIRIIDKINFNKFKTNPKWIIGYSDVTVFHQAINNLGFESIHAIMPTSTKTIKSSEVNGLNAVNSLKNILFGKELSYKIESNKHNKLGLVKGEIIGGNLSIISSLLGSKFSLKAKNKILFIEEVGEYKYSIDRMFQSLKLNGYFKDCSALILGGFTNIPENNPNFKMTIEELILDVVKEYDFPVCFDFPAGHITNNNSIIFGKNVTLEVGETTVLLKY